VGFVDTEWKGDTALKLGDRVRAHGIHTEPENARVYECLSNEFTLSNNFRQKTFGRVVEANQTPIKANISPNNAFSYNIPVLSRTIVNQVNCEYYALVDATSDTADDDITIDMGDCEITGSGNSFVLVATVELKKVYRQISNIIIERGPGISFIEVRKVTANKITLVFSATLAGRNLDDFVINIVSTIPPN